MNTPTNTHAPENPFAVLGLPASADEASVRARYLQLIKRHTPEQDPEKFRAIHRAYQAAKDPLLIATHLLAGMEENDPQPWGEIIEDHRRRPPRFTPELLLSFGNRAGHTSA